MRKNKPPPFARTLLEAYARLADIQDEIGRFRVAAQSDIHPLELPAEAVAHLVHAHQHMLEAHRIMEAALTEGEDCANCGKRTSELHSHMGESGQCLTCFKERWGAL